MVSSDDVVILIAFCSSAACYSVIGVLYAEHLWKSIRAVRNSAMVFSHLLSAFIAKGYRSICQVTITGRDELQFRQ